MAALPAPRARYCVEFEVAKRGERCVKLLRAERCAEGIAVEVVKLSRRGKAVEETALGTLAVLPRHVMVIRARDGSEYYVACDHHGRLVAAVRGDGWDAFLSAIRRIPPYFVRRSVGGVSADAIKALLPAVDLDGDILQLCARAAE